MEETDDKFKGPRPNDYRVMASLLYNLMFIRRRMELDECHSLMLLIYTKFRCEKIFKSADELEEFVVKWCPLVHLEVEATLGSKVLVWDKRGDKFYREKMQELGNQLAKEVDTKRRS